MEKTWLSGSIIPYSSERRFLSWRLPISNPKALTLSSFVSMFFLGVGITLIGAAARNIGLEYHLIGLLMFTQHLGFVLSVLVAGSLADVVSKTRRLLVGSAALGFSFLVFYATPVFWVNLAILFLGGIGVGVY